MSTEQDEKPGTARYEARADGGRWGVWDTVDGGWVTIGRFTRPTTRWDEQGDAAAVAERLTRADGPERKRIARTGLS